MSSWDSGTQIWCYQVSPPFSLLNIPKRTPEEKRLIIMVFVDQPAQSIHLYSGYHYISLDLPSYVHPFSYVGIKTKTMYWNFQRKNMCDQKRDGVTSHYVM